MPADGPGSVSVKEQRIIQRLCVRDSDSTSIFAHGAGQK